jgi:diguanylate cyclase (GGDEF)-like protein
VIKSCSRETDVVARFGGDEFSLVLPDTGAEGAISVATRILEKMRVARFLTSDGLSVSSDGVDWCSHADPRQAKIGGRTHERR